MRVATWLTNLDFDDESPVWRHWVAGLSAGHTLVRYDERGCGLSDRTVADLSVEAWLTDLEAVVEQHFLHADVEAFTDDDQAAAVRFEPFVDVVGELFEGDA